MNVYRIEGKNLDKLSQIFANWNETLIWSCLQGYMGSAWADSTENPKSAQIVIADFCFLAGAANENLLKNRPQEYKSDFVIMTPQNEKWATLIEKVYGSSATKVTRYAIKKEPNAFDTQKLRRLADGLSAEYKISLIDEKLYNEAKENKWSEDFCAQFKNYDEYRSLGLGVAVTHNGELVAGASSYTVYRGGIEIEIDTRKDHRRRGLATACAARLILECISRNLYPSWDAQNKWSAALAEKLGYSFDKEYYAYEINDYGSK